jgi:hypothetical protein
MQAIKEMNDTISKLREQLFNISEELRKIEKMEMENKMLFGVLERVAPEQLKEGIIKSLKERHSKPIGGIK